MAQINQVQRRQDDDPLSTIMKGLSIASQVYGIKANMAQLDDYQKKQDYEAQDRENAEFDREEALAAKEQETQRIAGNQFNKRELLDLGKSYDISDKPSEGAMQIASVEAPDSPLFVNYRRTAKASQAPVRVETVNAKGQPVQRFIDPSTGESVGKEFLSYQKPTEAKEKEVRTRLVSTLDENGQPVQMTVEDKPGQTFKSPLQSSMAKVKDPTKMQFTAASFGKRVETANKVFDELAESGFDRSSKREGIKSALIPSSFQSNEMKKQSQAERNFVNAMLRNESGAAISETEFDSAEQQYFPRAGDTPEVLDQKRQNREQAMLSLQAEAGPAWEKIPSAQLAKKSEKQESGTAFAADAPKPKLTDEDKSAIEWLKNNPKDPNAESVRKILQAKGI